jgi:hypothetical protein
VQSLAETNFPGVSLGRARTRITEFESCLSINWGETGEPER